MQPGQEKSGKYLVATWLLLILSELSVHLCLPDAVHGFNYVDCENTNVYSLRTGNPNRQLMAAVAQTKMFEKIKEWESRKYPVQDQPEDSSNSLAQSTKRRVAEV